MGLRNRGSEEMLKAVRILWETEGRRWDDLYEYPYSEWESDKIIDRLTTAVVKLNEAFPDGLPRH